MSTIKDTVLTGFHAIFGTDPQFIVRAPGRANLIGEHTDYNDGFVMPFAVDRAVWIAACPRDDAQIVVHTLDYGQQTITFNADQLHDNTLPHWTTYIRGSWALFAGKSQPVPGVDLLIGSDIPASGGMSSSAAIGVASIETLLALLGDTSKTQTEKALMAVRIEHEFTGVPVGVMDQIASAASPSASQAVLLDCRAPYQMQPVPLPASAAVIVINSRKERKLVGSPYAERRQQCEEAAELLSVTALRDTTMEAVESNREMLGDVRFRRARHVVTENERTLRMKAVLEQGDLQAAGELLNTSHASLRDDYEVSVHELDVLTEIARNHGACYGARIMGGGFGGCAVTMVQQSHVQEFSDAVSAAYAGETGLQPDFYVVSATPGSHVEFL